MLMRERKVQPTYSAQIRPELRQYIQSARSYALPAVSPVDAVGNLSAFVKSGVVTDFVQTVGGLGVKGNGSSGYYYQSVSILPGALWVACAFVANTVNNGQKTAYSLGSAASTTGAYFDICSGDGISTTNISAHFRGADSGTYIHKAGPVPVAGNLYVVVAVVPSTQKADAYLYVNGIKYTADGASSNNTAFSTSLVNESVLAIRRGTVSNYSPDTVLFTARGTGQIPESLARKISENPWFVFSDTPAKARGVAASGSGSVNLAGDSQSSATVFGTITTQVGVAAASVSLSTTAGSLNQSVDLSGGSASISVTNGTPTLQISLSGSMLSQSIAQALAGESVSLGGGGSAQSSNSGSVSLSVAISGADIAQAAADGVLSSADNVQLSGAMQSSAGAGGQAIVDIPLGGNVSAVASVAGGVSTIVQVSGLQTSVSALTGNLTVSGAIQMTAQALSDALSGGVLKLSVPLSGSALNAAAMNGLLTAAAINTGAWLRYRSYLQYHRYKMQKPSRRDNFRMLVSTS